MKTDPAPALRTWLERIPKVELHLHLEGAIPPEALWRLIGKYGGDATVPDFPALLDRFRYRDFGHFLEVWTWKNGFLREYEDFTFIAEAVARDLARQHIVYAEAYFSPGDFRRAGLATQKLAAAIRFGLARVSEIRIGLIGDLIRDHGPVVGGRTLRELAEVRDQGVIGIGIGGSEHEYPPEPYAEVYREARALGFHTTAHAGEAAGPESIWGALRALEVDRIGHGTRALEDESLVERLAQERTPLEMCPLSNVRTGVVRSIAEHPVATYLNRGLQVTINTDDPALFGNSLADEFEVLCRAFDLQGRDIRRLTANAVDATWLPPPEKEALRARVLEDPVWATAAKS
jgi:adenosine deaminase